MSRTQDDVAFAELANLIREELAAIPTEQWGYFFPTYVALWRFIEKMRPGVLGVIHAGFDIEPYFYGRHAHWFTDVLLQDPRIVDAAEATMYDVVDTLGDKLCGRNAIRLDELPALDHNTVQTLSSVALSLVDDALRTGVLA